MSGPAQHGRELRLIRGPSALGGGARRFFDLLWLIAATEFRLGYHGTMLGFLWSFARPILLFSIYLLVFTQIFRLGSLVPDYPAILLLNVLLFDFFSTTTQQASTSVVANEGIVRKMQFPRLVIPLSVVLTNALQLAVSLLVVFIFILAYGVEPVWTWVFLPVIVGALAIFTTSVAMLLSAVYVRLRDVGIVWSIVSTALLYATPILYTIDVADDVAPQFRDALLLNPLTPIFTQAREWIIDPSAPGAIEAVHGEPLLLIIPLVAFVGICLAGPLVFSREAPKVAEAL